MRYGYRVAVSTHIERRAAAVAKKTINYSAFKGVRGLSAEHKKVPPA
jgi:hypothetical protein